MYLTLQYVLLKLTAGKKRQNSAYQTRWLKTAAILQQIVFNFRVSVFLTLISDYSVEIRNLPVWV
jgi:hypothetical protein